jgi:hypothetical protein
MALFVACSILLGACGPTMQEPPSRGQVDSLVNVRVNALQLEMQAKNDSIINALARHRADSILAVMKSQNAATQPTVNK